jgi:hypothetical protein
LCGLINEEETNMHAMPDDEVERPSISPRRQEVERKLTVIEAKARVLARRHGRLAVGLALTAVAAFSLGMMFSRRRQRRSVVRRLHGAIPDSVWDLPEELAAQIKNLPEGLGAQLKDLPEELVAKLKKPLKRVAKAL